jgi:hypothetical protein
MRQTLENLKAKARDRAKRPTFVWDSLVQSFATMGNSRGWIGLVENKTNARRVSYAAIGMVDARARRAHIDRVLRDAIVRMPEQKARWLAGNFARIESMGGVRAASRAALAAPGRDAKLAFMLQFDGIGDKYARNIWMDVYHPDFYDAIAVDERIKKITAALGYTFAGYADHERFYQELALEAGLQPWELDRLLYHFNDRILASIVG